MVTAVLGGIIGTVVAGTLEFDTLQRLGVLLTVPRFRREPANGLAIGVAAGAGFAALETMGYAIAALVTSDGSIASVDGTLLLRGLLSPAGHVAWTGLTPAALWQAAAHRWRGRALPVFLATLVLAVALHATWDSVGTLVTYVVLAVIAFGLLLVVATGWPTHG